jgi:hypothetical protein
MSDYNKLLRDPKWQKRRLEIMSLDEFTCRMCYNDAETLNVHHLIYFKDRKPWEYEDQHLITLCEHCHKIQRSISLQKIFADLSINNSTALYVGFYLKKMIERYVNNPRCTEQAIWSMLHNEFEEEFKDGTIQEQLREYKAKYGEELM